MSEKNKRKKRKKSFLNDSNKILSITAIFVSAATLFILIYQTRLASKQFDMSLTQQKASILPYILVSHGRGDGDQYSILIENFGLGPAFINDVKIHYQDSVYAMDIPTFYFQVLEPNDYPNIMRAYANILEGHVIPSNRQIQHLNILYDKSKENYHNDVLYSDNIELEIGYESVYGDKWRVRGFNSAPVPVKD